MDRQDRPVDLLRGEFEDAVEDSPFGEPLFDRHLKKLTLEDAPLAWHRYHNAGTFFSYAMGLAAFGHPKAKIAFQACERWAKLCLEIAEPNEALPQFNAYYYLIASAWLQTATVPSELVSVFSEYSVRAEGIPDSPPFHWRARYSWAHALTGDWMRAQDTISKTKRTRPEGVTSRGAMSPFESLMWGYQHMAFGGPLDKRPELFVAALQTNLQETGLLQGTIPWLYLYRLIFATDVNPVNLLNLLRPGILAI